MEFTREEKIAQLGTLESHAERLRAELGMSGTGSEGDVIARNKAEEDLAALYDKLSGHEIVELSQKDPERWNKIVEARRSRNERGLFEKKRIR